MGNILYNGIKVSIYPDFSPDLQKQRAKFGEAKCKFQRLKISYVLLYPARLQVNTTGGTVFDSPEGVEDWNTTCKLARSVIFVLCLFFLE